MGYDSRISITQIALRSFLRISMYACRGKIDVRVFNITEPPNILIPVFVHSSSFQIFELPSELLRSRLFI